MYLLEQQLCVEPVMCLYFYSVHSQSLEPASTHTQSSEQYATSDTSELDTSITETSPDIDSSEPKSQGKTTVRFMYRHCVQDTMYRTLCTGHHVQTLCTGH